MENLDTLRQSYAKAMAEDRLRASAALDAATMYARRLAAVTGLSAQVHLVAFGAASVHIAEFDLWLYVVEQRYTGEYLLQTNDFLQVPVHLTSPVSEEEVVQHIASRQVWLEVQEEAEWSDSTMS